MSVLEEPVIVTNSNMIYKKTGGFMKYFFLLLLMTIVSCSSGKIIPTTDICTVKKHYKDSIFQVYINKDPINNNWYIYQDAIDITKKLADDNKCMH